MSNSHLLFLTSSRPTSAGKTPYGYASYAYIKPVNVFSVKIGIAKINPQFAFIFIFYSY